MASYHAHIDTRLLKRRVNAELRRIGNKTIDSFSRQDKLQIGLATIDAMEEMISKGQSPIQGFGRFPAYKAVAAGNKILRGGRATTRAGRARRRGLAQKTKRAGYPYTVRHQYPSKRERPVNLYLSGEFMRDLDTRPRRRGIEIGFYRKKSVLKEEGHRYGTNGQPIRPTIPIGSEKFHRFVWNRFLERVQLHVKDAIARAIKG